MSRQVLTKLNENDLKNICGGQIYSATGNNGKLFFVPSVNTTKSYNCFSTRAKALSCAKMNGLWLDETSCDSYLQASLAASSYTTWYKMRGSVPREMNPNKWQDQYFDLQWRNEVDSFVY